MFDFSWARGFFSDNKYIVITIVITMVALAFGFVVGYSISNRSWEKECVKRGYAKYAVEKDGSPKWVWKK